MTDTYCIKCMTNGNPSVFSIRPSMNVHFYVDMTGESEVTYFDHTIAIPVENGQDYARYQDLPQHELDQYFNSLMKRIMELHADEDRKMLDICKIQYELLSEYWSQWVRVRYIHRNAVRPLVLALYAPKRTTWL